MNMNSSPSPKPARRFSRWQTRKRTFVLGGTAFTAPSDNAKTAASQKVTRCGGHFGKEGKTVQQEAESLESVGNEHLETSNKESHALVSLSQNATISDAVTESQNTTLKKLNEKVPNANDLDDELIISGNDDEQRFPEIDVGNTVNEQGKSSAEGSQDSNSEATLFEKENTESISVTSLSLNPSVSKEKTDGKPRVSSSSNSNATEIVNRSGPSLASSDREKDRLEPDKHNDEDSIIIQNELLQKNDEQIVLINEQENPLITYPQDAEPEIYGKPRIKEHHTSSNTSQIGTDISAAETQDNCLQKSPEKNSNWDNLDDEQIATEIQDNCLQKSPEKNSNSNNLDDEQIATDISAAEIQDNCLQKSPEKNSNSDNLDDEQIVLVNEQENLLTSYSQDAGKDSEGSKPGSNREEKTLPETSKILFNASASRKHVLNESKSMPQDEIEAEGCKSHSASLTGSDQVASHNVISDSNSGNKEDLNESGSKNSLASEDEPYDSDSKMSKSLSKSIQLEESGCRPEVKSSKNKNASSVKSTKFSSVEVEEDERPDNLLDSSKKEEHHVDLNDSLRNRSCLTKAVLTTPKKKGTILVSVRKCSSPSSSDSNERKGKVSPILKKGSIKEREKNRVEGVEHSNNLLDSSKKEVYRVEANDSLSGLRNRNSLTKPGGMQYPMEFMDSKQKKHLSQKAREMLMNTSVGSKTNINISSNSEIQSKGSATDKSLAKENTESGRRAILITPIKKVTKLVSVRKSSSPSSSNSDKKKGKVGQILEKSMKETKKSRAEVVDVEPSNNLLDSSRKEAHHDEANDSLSGRGLRNRNSLTKPGGMQYPMEFMDSKQKRDLSQKAREMLMNTSVSKKTNISSNSEIQSKGSATGKIYSKSKENNESGRRKLFASKDEPSNTNSKISKSSNKSKHSEPAAESPMKKNAGSIRTQKFSSSTRRQLVMSNNEHMSPSPESNSAKGSASGNTNIVQKNTESKILTSPKKKVKKMVRKSSSPSSPGSDKKKGKVGQILEKSIKETQKSRVEVDPDEANDSLSGRGLRNRNSLTKPGGMQYPMEFWSSKQKKDLSQKAREILLNTSLNKSQISNTNFKSATSKLKKASISSKSNTQRRGRATGESSAKENTDVVVTQKNSRKKSLILNEEISDRHTNPITSDDEGSRIPSVKPQAKFSKSKVAIRRPLKYSLPRKAPKCLKMSVPMPDVPSQEAFSRSTDHVSKSFVMADSALVETSSKQSEKADRKALPVDKNQASSQLDDTVCGVYKVARKRKLSFGSEPAHKISRRDQTTRANKQQSESESEGDLHHASANMRDSTRENSKTQKVSSKPAANSKSKVKQSVAKEPVAVGRKTGVSKDQTRLKTNSRSTDPKGGKVNISEWLSAYQNLLGKLDSRYS